MADEKKNSIAPLLYGLAGVTGLEGIYSLFTGLNAMKNLHKEKFPLQSEDPQMRASRERANIGARYGFSPQEKAAWMQQNASNINTQTQRAMDASGGALGRVIAGTQNISNQKSLGDFAQRDAQLKLSKERYADSFSQNLQNIANNNIRTQQQTRLMAENALGQGVADSRSRLMGVGNTLITAGVLDNQDQNHVFDTNNDQFGWYKRLMGVGGQPTNSLSPGLPPQGTTDWENTGGYR